MRRPEIPEFKLRLIEWIAGVAVTLVALTAYAYTTFETKEDAREKKGDIVQRLDRIETKLDQMIQNGGGKSDE